MSGSALYETFARAPLSFDRGEGSWLVTDDGQRYLDFAAGIAVNSLGHGHPHLVAALTEQAGKLWHVSNLYEIPGQRRLGERIVAASFADKVFFTNSGAEALECAIKTARRYHYVGGRPERFRTITFEGAFHGRTLATIAAGGQQKYLEGFGPKADGFDQVAFDDIDAAEKLIGPETAAILIEPVQGEGGVRTVPPASLRRLRELCDKHGLLLIFDEVQCGVGRTGRFLAHEWAGVAPRSRGDRQGHRRRLPDGRLPCHGRGRGRHDRRRPRHHLRRQSARHGRRQCRARRRARRRLPRRGQPQVAADEAGAGGNRRRIPRASSRRSAAPACCSASNAAIPNARLNAALRDEKLLAVPAGDNVIRLLPPLTVSDEEIREALRRIRAGARAVSTLPAAAAS